MIQAFTCIFYEKLSKSLKIHCFATNKNDKLVVSITLVVGSSVKGERIDPA